MAEREREDLMEGEGEVIRAVQSLVTTCSAIFPSGFASLEIDVSRGRVQLRMSGAMRGAVTAGLVESRPPAMLQPKWNVPGHQLIAQIAEDLLLDDAPDALEALMTIMRDDPDPKRRGFGGFAEYAAWPDTNKSDAAFKARTGKWHYIDLAYNPDDPKPTPFPLPDGPHVLSALAEQRDVLADGGTPDARGRADALAFVLHLVGDIHQPLHCIELRNADFPDGDHGGNALELAQGGRNLHALWDGVLVPRAIDTKRTSQDLLTKYPRATFADDLTKADPEEWVWESHAIGRRAYDEILAESEDTRASKAYRSRARAIAERRAVLGAYRLADLLRATFT